MSPYVALIEISLISPSHLLIHIQFPFDSYHQRESCSPPVMWNCSEIHFWNTHSWSASKSWAASRPTCRLPPARAVANEKSSSNTRAKKWKRRRWRRGREAKTATEHAAKRKAGRKEVDRNEGGGIEAWVCACVCLSVCVCAEQSVQEMANFLMLPKTH